MEELWSPQNRLNPQETEYEKIQRLVNTLTQAEKKVLLAIQELLVDDNGTKEDLA